MSEAGGVGGRDGPRGTAGYVGSLVARAIERSRGKGMRLVLSSYHGRRCISIRVIAAGTFFFSIVHVCVVGSSPQALSFLVSLPLVFFLFRCRRFSVYSFRRSSRFSHLGRRCFLRFEVAGGVFIRFLCRRSFVSLQLAFLMNAALLGTPAISVAAFTRSRIGKASITTTISTSIITLLRSNLGPSTLLLPPRTTCPAPFECQLARGLPTRFPVASSHVVCQPAHHVVR